MANKQYPARKNTVTLTEDLEDLLVSTQDVIESHLYFRNERSAANLRDQVHQLLVALTPPWEEP